MNLRTVAAQQRRVEVRVELPVSVGLAAERRLVPAHRVRERPLEQGVVAAEEPLRAAASASRCGVVEVGQALGRARGMTSVSNGQVAQNGTTISQLVVLVDDPRPAASPGAA